MTDFSTEFPKRREHVDALPGKSYYEMCEALNRAAELFNTNQVELANHLESFLGRPVFVMELPDRFAVEASRLLFNYLASLAGLRDAQRVAHRTLWPVGDAEELRCDVCGRRDPKRSTWEVEVWDPKRKELLGDPRIVFLTKLRDYSMHYAIPITNTVTQWQNMAGSGGQSAMTNKVGLSRSRLLKWDAWSAPARQFITTKHNDDFIELPPLVDFFSGRVREFIQWFFQEIDKKVGPEIREYADKHNDLTFWYRVHEASGQYKAIRNLEHLKRRVQARLQRAGYHPSVWRTITCDRNGVCVVGDSDWPPLPADPRF